MKRPFINRTVSLGLLAIVACFVTACVKETLVLPEGVNGNAQEEIDIITKPSYISVQGDYNYGFKVEWPQQLSKSLAEIIIEYEVEGEKTTLEIDDFSETLFLDVGAQEVRTVDFSLYAISASGKKSKPSIQTVKSKGLYLTEVANAIEISRGAYLQMKMKVGNPLVQTIEVEYTVPTLQDSVTHTLTITEEEKEGLFDGLVGENSISVKLIDSLGNTVIKEVPYEPQPTSYLSGTQKSGWTPYTNSPYDSEGGFNVSTILDGAKGEWGNSYASGGGRDKEISVFFTTRRNTDYPSYDHASLRNPEGPYEPIIVSKIRLSLMEPDFGHYPQTIKLVGVKEDKSHVEIGVYSPGEVNSYEIPTESNLDKWVGFVLTLDNENFGNTAIGEVDVFGFGE